ncbi:meiotic nuclear division protein 1 homolog isoform X4 [Panicum hallii]|uniref:meiotic nuclear division protein 1 homolog isoform X4 n=1 Tax=Panicum hallii TaxID=206008 RepID=UPI000DF4DF13|nr:meiotic nuclear division protein 1 homolog isoform X4 [Panicum hallii]
MPSSTSQRRGVSRWRRKGSKCFKYFMRVKTSIWCTFGVFQVVLGTRYCYDHFISALLGLHTLLRNTYNKLESDLSNSKKRYVELVEHRDNLKRGREDSEERESALEELKAVELHHKKLKEELAAYADSDPAAVEAMKDAIDVAHSAANRWTDNIFTLQQWCSTTFPQAKEQLEHMYREVGITEDFEYLQ